MDDRERIILEREADDMAKLRRQQQQPSGGCLVMLGSLGLVAYWLLSHGLMKG